MLKSVSKTSEKCIEMCKCASCKIVVFCNLGFLFTSYCWPTKSWSVNWWVRILSSWSLRITTSSLVAQWDSIWICLSSECIIRFLLLCSSCLSWDYDTQSSQPVHYSFDSPLKISYHPANHFNSYTTNVTVYLQKWNTGEIAQCNEYLFSIHQEFPAKNK